MKLFVLTPAQKRLNDEIDAILDGDYGCALKTRLSCARIKASFLQPDAHVDTSESRMIFEVAFPTTIKSSWGDVDQVKVEVSGSGLDRDAGVLSVTLLRDGNLFYELFYVLSHARDVGRLAVMLEAAICHDPAVSDSNLPTSAQDFEPALKAFLLERDTKCWEGTVRALLLAMGYSDLPAGYPAKARSWIEELFWRDEASSISRDWRCTAYSLGKGQRKRQVGFAPVLKDGADRGELGLFVNEC